MGRPRPSGENTEKWEASNASSSTPLHFPHRKCCIFRAASSSPSSDAELLLLTKVTPALQGKSNAPHPHPQTPSTNPSRNSQIEQDWEPASSSGGNSKRLHCFFRPKGKTTPPLDSYNGSVLPILLPWRHEPAKLQNPTLTPDWWLSKKEKFKGWTTRAHLRGGRRIGGRLGLT
jgi:hypothetical protein